MALYERIDKLFWEVWDPIGVFGTPEARDEYYGYLPQVFALAVRGSPPREIARNLNEVERRRMGLPGNRRRSMLVARKVVAEAAALLEH
jgi:hypothetical protein